MGKKKTTKSNQTASTEEVKGQEKVEKKEIKKEEEKLNPKVEEKSAPKDPEKSVSPKPKTPSSPGKTKWNPKDEKRQKISKQMKQKEQKKERRQERVKGKKVKKEESPLRQLWLYHLRPWCRRHYILVTSSVSTVVLLVALFLAKDTMEQQEQRRHNLPEVTDQVTFNINVNNETRGDLMLGLYGKDCPLTVKNFVALSTHEPGFGYIGTKFHTIFTGHMIMGGDVVFNNGTGGRSAILEQFETENLKLRHTVPGTLGMVGLQNNTDSRRSSQFYITFQPTPGFDGIAVVFGRVIKGHDFLKQLNRVPVGKDLRPEKLVVIEDAAHQKL